MFTITYGPAVKKDLKKLDRPVLRVVEKEFIVLSNNPRAGQKLTAEHSDYFSYHFKVNKTEYRIIYKIKDQQLMVYIIMVGSRENIYDKLKRRV